MSCLSLDRRLDVCDDSDTIWKTAYDIVIIRQRGIVAAGECCQEDFGEIVKVSEGGTAWREDASGWVILGLVRGDATLLCTGGGLW